MHLWSNLGKINFSPRWNDQMTCLMSQLISRHKNISNELYELNFELRKTFKS